MLCRLDRSILFYVDTLPVVNFEIIHTGNERN
nr:MAG TPA: hypothetical protein [Caudoviricetes sp.]